MPREISARPKSKSWSTGKTRLLDIIRGRGYYRLSSHELFFSLQSCRRYSPMLRRSSRLQGVRIAAGPRSGLARWMMVVNCLVLAFASRSGAQEIGFYDEAIHDHVEVTFRFDMNGGTADVLNLGLGGSFNPAGGFIGCQFELYDAGGLISNASINSIFGCQGNWRSNSQTDSLTIDTNVDLSGIAAGELGRIAMRPIFTEQAGGQFNFSSPSLGIGLSRPTFVAGRVVTIPEPSTFTLFAIACLGALVSRRPL